MPTPISTGSEWTFELLARYDEAIGRIARDEYGLDCYANQIEVIDSRQMLDAYATTGLPVGYPHWSFGKSFIAHEHAYRKGARGLARETLPDVILLDLNLPDIHGHEVIKLMRAEPTLAATPIVVISGERSIVTARAISLGATASHSKPLDFGELLETLDRLETSSPQPSA